MASFGRVIDASNVNPLTEKVARAAHVVAIIDKATEGENFHDGTLTATRRLAKKLGKPFGSYLFLRPSHPGKLQAEAYLGLARPRRGDIEPIIDAEVTDGHSMARVANCVDHCALRFERDGYRPILYGSTSFLEGLYAANPTLRRLRVWQAEYPSFLPATLKKRLALRHRLGHTVVMWQYTSRWPILGRRFDGSYLLQPIEHLLIQPNL